jgi:hypothetical protein
VEFGCGAKDYGQAVLGHARKYNEIDKSANFCHLPFCSVSNRFAHILRTLDCSTNWRSSACELWRKKWNSDLMVSKELEAPMNHIEKELAEKITKSRAAKAGK